ncbi:MAG: hypothetical protein DRJ65_14845 [Acidobacteria bacterium]|nr:MAG: hypothetical protein DRJ65_14845 [Acidobacteriota bacterium]
MLMPITITSTAPCRADLAGGTLDIWPLGLLHNKALTVNMALPVSVVLEVSNDAPDTVVLHRVSGGPWRSLRPGDTSNDLTAAICFHLAPRGGLKVDVLSQAPMGSGLGGSSAFGVALTRAAAKISNLDFSDEQIVHLVQDLEARLLGTLTGCQDHWAAVRGGIQALHLEPGGNRLERLCTDHRWLESRVTVFFTGITHHSGMVNWQIIRRRLEGDRKTTQALQLIADAANLCRTALLSADCDALGNALRQEWAARRRLAPEICPPELAHLEAEAMEAGALAFKACGAGGGGSVLILHEPAMADPIAEALMSTAPAGELFPRGVAVDGCNVI